MKKNTTQAPEQTYIPIPHKTTAGDRVLFTAIVLVAIGTIASVSIQGFKKFGTGPTVECNKCNHIVARKSAIKKTEFEQMYGQDRKHKTLHFCTAHKPAWDYTVGGEFFRARSDEQINEDGSEVERVMTFVGNGVMTIDGIGYTAGQSWTNRGGHSLSKHLHY